MNRGKAYLCQTYFQSSINTIQLRVKVQVNWNFPIHSSPDKTQIKLEIDTPEKANTN